MSWQSLTRRGGRKPRSAFTKNPVSVKIVKSTRRKALTQRNLTTRIPKAFGNPVAQRTFAWLKYNVDGAFATGAAGQVGSQIYNLNSIFDPDRSGVGHQPYGHDTYQTLYNRYRVHKCRWNMVFYGTSAAPCQITVVPLNNVNVTDQTLAIEMSSQSKRHIVSQNGTGMCRVSGVVDLQKLNGASVAEYKTDDRFEALFGSSPGELMGLYIFVNSNLGSQGSIIANISIEYYTEMFDPIPLAQS